MKTLFTQFNFFPLVFILLAFQGKSQNCFLSGVTFSTQASINNFSTNYPGCTHIGGDVYIGTAITDVSPLNQLVSIGGHLVIRYNTSLTSISGFNNLTNVGGDLEIRGNNNVTQISAFNSLSTIGGHFILDGNLALTSISDLPSLTSISNDLFIRGNNALVSFSGFNSITNIGGHYFVDGNLALTGIPTMPNLISVSNDFKIRGNNALVSFSGYNNLATIGGHFFLDGNLALSGIPTMPSLTSVANDFWIRGNNSLVSFSGFNNLATIGGHYFLDGNTALTGINALQNLTTISNDLWFRGNNALTSLAGLQNLNAVNGTIRIQNNLSLSICHIQSLCDLLPGSGTQISGNATGCNSVTQVLNLCQTNPPNISVPLHNDICSGSPSMFTVIKANDNNAVYDNYKFRFYDGDPNSGGTLIETIIVPKNGAPNFLTGSTLQFQQTYWATVAVEVNGVYSTEGTSCSFCFINSTKMISAQCDANVPILSTIISPSQNGFDEYKYVYYTENPSINPNSAIDSVVILGGQSLRYYQTLPNLMIQHQYYVVVKNKIRNSWSNAGPACFFTLVNDVKLVSAHCNSSNVGVLQEYIYSNDILAQFTQYKFRYYTADPNVNPGSIVDSIVLNQGLPRYYSDTLPNLVPEQLYYVTVSINFRGVWSQPGPLCTMRLGNNVKLLSSHCNSSNVGILQQYIYSNDLLVKFPQYKFRYYSANPTVNPTSIVDSIVLNQGSQRYYYDTLHHLIPGQLYYVTVSVLFRGVWLQPGPVCTMRLGNDVKLISSHCNSNNVGIYQEKISSNDVLTKFAQYKFRYYTANPTTNPNSILDSIVMNTLESRFYSDTLHNLTPGHEYYVTISIFFRGVWLQPGPVCTMRLGNNVKLISSQCNNNNVGIHQEKISSNDVLTKFAQYKFRYYTADPITNPNSIVDSITVNRNESIYYSDALPNLNLNQQYYATVSILFRGVWMQPGPVCTMKLQNNVKLISGHCNNQNVAIFQERINSNDVLTRFDQYKFKYYTADPTTNPGSFVDSVILVRNQNAKYKDEAKFLDLNTVYYATVSILYKGSWSSPGPVCSLTLVNNLQIRQNLCNQNVKLNDVILASDNNAQFDTYWFKFYSQNPVTNPGTLVGEVELYKNDPKTFAEATPFLALGQTYWVTVSLVYNDEVSNPSAACTITLSNPIQLHPDLCGQLIPIDMPIAADDNNLVFSQYKYKIYDTGPASNPSAFLYEFVVALGQYPTFLASFPGAEFNNEYFITVSPGVNNSFPFAGAACSVTFINDVKLHPNLCDDDVYENDLLIADDNNVVYDEYRFTFYDADPSGTASQLGQVTVANGQQPTFASVAPFLLNSQTIWVTVSVKKNGVFSNVGSACSFNYVLPCVADAGDLSNNALDPAILATERGTDLISNNQQVIFTNAYGAPGEVNPGATYSYALLLVNRFNKIKQYTINGSANHGNFDYATLAPGTHYVYGLSYKNTVPVSQYLDNIIAQNLSNDITKIASDDIANGGNFCLNLDDGTVSGHSNQIEITPTVSDYFWVNGTGNWSDVGHWAKCSGCTNNLQSTVPVAGKNVYFDENSGFTATSIVTMDLNFTECTDMDWSGVSDVEIPCANVMVGPFKETITSVPNTTWKNPWNNLAYYRVHSFIAPYTGVYKFSFVGGGNNVAAVLYHTAFNPASPAVNRITFASYSNNASSLISATLTCGQVYYLVMSTRYAFGISTMYEVSVSYQKTLPKLAGTGDLYISGSLTFSAHVQNNYSGEIHFRANDVGNTISLKGQHLKGAFFEGSGEYILQDDFSCGRLIFYGGIIRTNDKNVDVKGQFYSVGPGARTMYLGSSMISTRTLYLRGGNFASYPGTSTFILSPGTNELVDGGNIPLYDLKTKNSNEYGVYENLKIIGKAEFYDNILRLNRSNFSGDVTFYKTVGLFVSGNSVSNNIFNGITTYHDRIREDSGNNTYNKAIYNGNIYTHISNSNSYKHAVFNANATLYNNNTFDTLTLSPSYTFNLGAGKTQTIKDSIFMTGTSCGTEVNIKSLISGSQATIKKINGLVSSEFVTLQDINYIGAGTFTASNSTDLGNNTNITISGLVPRNLYWVGGTGNWSDPLHWSLNNDGTGSGACPPGAFDNVYFNSYSGFISPDTVRVNIPSAYCRDMDWTGVLQMPRLDGSGDLYIHGSLTFTNHMTNFYNGQVHFKAVDAGNTITLAGNGFKQNVYFEGNGGEYILQDSFSCINLYLDNGTLRTNDNSLSLSGTFISASTSMRSMYLGSSTITAKRLYFRNGGNFTSYPGTSTFILSPGTNELVDGGNIPLYDLKTKNSNEYGVYENLKIIGKAEFYDNILRLNRSNFSGDVTFYKTVGLFVSGNSVSNNIFNGITTYHDRIREDSGNNTYNKAIYNGNIYTHISNSNSYKHAVFNANATLYNNNTFDTLTLSPGYTFNLGAGKTQTIEDSLIVSGTPIGIILIKSNTAGVRAKISKSGGRICGSYLSLLDIHNSGSASFYAGAPPDSQDNGNNLNIIFADCPNNLSEPEEDQMNVYTKTSSHLTIGAAFPNPSSGIGIIAIPIKSSYKTNYDFILTDQNGLPLIKRHNQPIDSEDSQIIVDKNLAPGIYFYRIMSDGQHFSNRIIILH